MRNATVILVFLACALVFTQSLLAMPPLKGGLEPVLPAGVNAPDRAWLDRDDTDLEGEWNCLVILVDFDDYTWENQEDTLFNNEGSPFTPEHFINMLFSELEYAHPGAESEYTGSMRDYYGEVSGDAFTVTGVVTEWIRAPRPYAYYCNGDGEFGTPDDNGYRPYPQNIQGLVEEIVAAADEDVNYQDFDNDGDGTVDALFIVHAGPGAEAIGRNEVGANYFWSHKWYIPEVELDEVIISGYSLQPQDGTIGVFCHEFGHTLGLPDLYDIDGSSEGIGEWGLMGSGGWCYRPGDPAGSSPSHLTAWSKIQFGWLEVINVTELMEDVEIPPVETDGVVYRMWTNGDEGDEYFLVENRRRIGFDAGITRRQVEYDLPAPAGLLVTHIDDTRRTFDNTDNIDDNHRLVDVEEASPVWIDGHPFEQIDGERWRPEDLNLYNPNRGDNGDLWPGFSETTEDSTDYTGQRDRSRFSIFSTPSSSSYAGGPSLVDIYDMSLEGDNIIADLNVNAPESPLLYIADIIFDDEEGGNGDGSFEPGESLEITAVVRNIGLVNAEDVSALLLYAGEYAEVERGEIEYPDIASNSEANPAEPFVVHILDIAPLRTDLNFTMVISCAGDFEFSYPVTILVSPSGEWFKYPTNPVIAGNPDDWDGGVISPALLVENDTLKCWYVGANPESDPPNPGSVGYCWSPDGGITWQRFGRPVITPDENRRWMNGSISGIGIVNPFGDIYIMMIASTGIQDEDSTTNIGIAFSDDGIDWIISDDPLLTSDNGWWQDILPLQLAVLADENGISIWFTVINRMSLPVIALASTEDFENWEVNPDPVLAGTFNPDDFDAYAVVAPDAILLGESITGLYTGFTNDMIGRLGMFCVSDSGEITRYDGSGTGGSILEPGGENGWEGENHIIGGRLFAWHDETRLLYAGANDDLGSSAIGLALQYPVDLYAPGYSDAYPVQPSALILNPAFPNPFNSTTRITYTLHNAGKVKIIIQDLNGREVAKLLDDYQETGFYNLTWNSMNSRLMPVSSGTYFVKASVNDRAFIQQVLLLK